MPPRLISPPLALALALPLISAGPSLAGEAGTKGAVSNVDIASVAIPIIVDGKIRNYVFVAVRVVLADGADGIAAHAKEPYVRDSLLKAAHRTPYTVPGDWTRVNEAAIKQRVLTDAKTFMGAAAVRSVEIIAVTPQRRAGMIPSRPGQTKNARPL